VKNLKSARVRGVADADFLDREFGHSKKVI